MPKFKGMLGYYQYYLQTSLRNMVKNLQYSVMSFDKKFLKCFENINSSLPVRSDSSHEDSEGLYHRCK